MPLELRDTPKRDRFVEAARRLRILDEPFVRRTSAEVEELVRQQALAPLRREPSNISGSPISSSQQREFLKDAKASASILASEANGLESEIVKASRQAFAFLDDIQQEVVSLESMVTEDEVRGYSGATHVHFNAFTRPQDHAVDYDAGGWLQDFKTGLTLLPSNMCSLVPGLGLVLPIANTETCLVRDVFVVSEETDFGDGWKSIDVGDPLDLIRPHRTYRHVVIKREFDENGSFAQTPARLTLAVQLPNSQMVNFLAVRPLGHSPVVIDAVYALDEAGTWVALDTVATASTTFTTLVFAPVRTACLKVVFNQYAVVAKTELLLSDPRTTSINNLLRGAGFTQLLPETEETVQGRVYDFSLEQLTVGLRQYTSLGVYRSPVRTVSNPTGIGFNYSHRATGIDVAVGLPERPVTSGSVTPEFYIGTRVLVGGQQWVNRLIPVLTPGRQAELLPLLGGEGALRFIPDLRDDAGTALQVTKNGSALAIGTDYEVSIDGGATWYDNWTDAATVFDDVINKTCAGRARIRILVVDHTAYYCVNYAHYHRQRLTPDGLVTLRNQKMVFDRKLRGCKAHLQTVCILRATSNNAYVTPIVLSYLLKVRENVA